MSRRVLALWLIFVACAEPAAPPVSSQSPEASQEMPSASASAPPEPSAVLVGAGDIASCALPGAEATARLLDRTPGTVFTAGDNAYEKGSPAEFSGCYDPTWGRHRKRTRPAIGSHEYETAAAEGYFAYFAAARGPRPGAYYSYEIPLAARSESARGSDGDGWHIVVLNSNCEIVACAAGSEQERWLRADLAAHPARCTLGIWHHPLFSSGEHGNDRSTRALWAALYEVGADVVIVGHDHHYERFAPQDQDGRADPERGIREFVVGTGGASLRTAPRRVANSEVVRTGTWGVLKLTLYADRYEWEFVPVDGPVLDSGDARCH